MHRYWWLFFVVGYLTKPPDPPPGPPVPEWDSVDVYLFGLIESTTAFLANAINTFAGIVGSIFKAAAGFLHTLWRDYVKVAINWLVEHMRKFRDWLKRTLKPIIARLEKIKKWYDQHVLKQQLRQIQMIQRIRQFLAILRLLHVGWASKLDNALVDVQNRIEQSIAIVRGTLNQIINTLTLAFTPELIFTRGIIGASLLSNIGALKRILGFGDGRIISASEQATIDKQHSLYFASTVKTHLQELNSTGLTQDDKDNRTAARQALADATNAPLPF